MPDSLRTRFIAYGMNEVYDMVVELGAEDDSKRHSLEIAYSLGALSYDTGFDYLHNQDDQDRLAHFISPPSDEARSALRDLDIDPQTGLGSRVALDKALPRANSHRNISIIIFDGDKFGQVNKQAGLKLGDQAILDLAKTIKTVAEEFGCGDRVFRRGDNADEFLVIAKSSIAEKLKDSVITTYGTREYGSASVSVTGGLGRNDDEADLNLRIAKIEKHRQEHFMSRIFRTFVSR